MTAHLLLATAVMTMGLLWIGLQGPRKVLQQLRYVVQIKLTLPKQMGTNARASPFDTIPSAQPCGWRLCITCVQLQLV